MKQGHKALASAWRKLARSGDRHDLQCSILPSSLMKERLCAISCFDALKGDTHVDYVSAKETDTHSDGQLDTIREYWGLGKPLGSMLHPPLWPHLSAARPAGNALISSGCSSHRFSSTLFAQGQHRPRAGDVAASSAYSSAAVQAHAGQELGRWHRTFASSRSASPPLREDQDFDSSPPEADADSSLGAAPHSPGSTASEAAHLEAAPDAPFATTGETFVYEGPLAVTVRRLKKLSLFSCMCTLAAAPVIVGLDAGSSMGAKISIAIMLASIGLFTTGLLHWFTSPYIHRMVYHRKTGMVDLESLTMLARPRRESFHVASVAYPQTYRPQATFQVNGKVFYVDADNCADLELLRLLSPPDPDAVPQDPPQASS